MFLKASEYKALNQLNLITLISYRDIHINYRNCISFHHNYSTMKKFLIFSLITAIALACSPKKGKNLTGYYSSMGGKTSVRLVIEKKTFSLAIDDVQHQGKLEAIDEGYSLLNEEKKQVGTLTQQENGIRIIYNGTSNKALYKVPSITDNAKSAFLAHQDLVFTGDVIDAQLRLGKTYAIQLGEEKSTGSIGKQESDLQAGIKKWNLEIEGQPATLEITKDKCKNGLASLLHYKEVYYEACAFLLNPKLQLHSNWQLLKMNGVNLPDIDFPKGRPLLDIDAIDNTYSGITGCNFIGGGIIIGDGTIQFRSGPITRMACPDQDFENNYVRSIGREWNFRIIKNELHLTDGDESFVFIKG